jgi:hypothetical protein
MSDDFELVYFKMNLLQVEIAMNGMIAENRMREIAGASPAYGEDAFQALIDEYGIHHNKFPQYRGY